MKYFEPKWSVSWGSADRSDLFMATRDSAKYSEQWRDRIISSMSPVEDYEPDIINASIEVSSLEELRELLVATSKVRADHGVSVNVLFGDGPIRASAMLNESHHRFAKGSAYVSVQKADASELRKKLSEVRGQLNEIMSRLDESEVPQ